MIRFFLTIFLVLGTLSTVCFADNVTPLSKEVGNGGDDVGIDFQASFDHAIQTIKTAPHSSLSEIGKLNFKSKLPELKIITVTEPIEVSVGSAVQESTAVNYPANQLVKVNRDRWNAITSAGIKEGLALHEVLSLLGMESTGSYKYSAAYASQFGFTEKDIAQSFDLVIESKEFNSGGNIYSITAVERWATPSFFENIQIDYVVKKNGIVQSSIENWGGVLRSCSYGDPSSGALPTHFVDLISFDGQATGFWLRGLGVCGNVTESRFQIILPSATNRFYAAKEFISAENDLIFQTKNNQSQIWYLTQEWGLCGTAGSFYVPHVFNINLTGFDPIVAGKLPSQLQDIPKFGLPVDPFASIYAGGIQGLDWQAMNSAMTYFLDTDDFKNRNKWCGLPVSRDEALSQISSMKTLSGVLSAFPRQ